MKFFKKSYEATRPIMYGSSIDALREIIESDGRTEVVRITPKITNFPMELIIVVVGIKTINGDYLIQAYGTEAIELHKKASFMVERPLMLVNYVK